MQTTAVHRKKTRKKMCRCYKKKNARFCLRYTHHKHVQRANTTTLQQYKGEQRRGGPRSGDDHRFSHPENQHTEDLGYSNNCCCVSTRSKLQNCGAQSKAYCHPPPQRSGQAYAAEESTSSSSPSLQRCSRQERPCRRRLLQVPMPARPPPLGPAHLVQPEAAAAAVAAAAAAVQMTVQDSFLSLPLARPRRRPAHRSLVLQR